MRKNRCCCTATRCSISLLVLHAIKFLSLLEVNAYDVDPVLEVSLEKNILIELYKATNGDEWIRKNNWLSTPVHHCDWQGVTCINPTESSGRRRRTARTRRKLFKEDITQASSEEEEWGERSDASNLDDIDKRRRFDKRLLQSFMPGDDILDNQDDNDSSSNNQQNDDLRSIEKIDLSDNNLNGPVPLNLLLYLPNIRTIKLNGNYNVDYSKRSEQEFKILKENIDTSTPIKSNVKHLDLSHTTINSSLENIFRSGSTLQTVIDTPNLVELYVSQTQILSKEFPDFLFDSTHCKLERLSLDHNNIYGEIPLSIGNCKNFKYVNMANNFLSGQIPITFTNLNKLRYLLLERNTLTGTIPLPLSSDEYTPLLEQLDLSDQRDINTPPSQDGKNAGLTGTIPAFNTQKRLRRVDLGVNSFYGQVPPNLLSAVDMSEFDYIILSSNQLTGQVPSGIISRLGESDGLFLDDNLITSIKENECDSILDLEYGCKSILCPPGTYEPRAGRQEEESRPCLDCPQNTLYWGQLNCYITSPTNPITAKPTIKPPSPTEPGEPVQPTLKPTPYPTSEGHLSMNEQRNILIEFYKATGGDLWTNNDGWVTGIEDDTASFCGDDNGGGNWFGITCTTSKDSVLGIHLDKNNLVGLVESETLFKLPDLNILTLSHNEQLTFTFKGLSQSTSIEVIDVSSIQLSDDYATNLLDSTVYGDQFLQDLHMSDIKSNVLAGNTIPSELWRLTALKQLTLDYNDIVGSISSEIGYLSNLIVFSVVNNVISGSIPKSIENLKDITTLRLSTNHMGGTIPTEINLLTGLTNLDLSNQWSNGQDDDYSTDEKPGFVGPLPSFEGYKQLRRLDLSINSLTGTIPANFLKGMTMTSSTSQQGDGLLERIDLSENFLDGSVPKIIADLKIRNIYLQDNMFTSIDQFVCDALPGDLFQYGCDAVLCPPGTYGLNYGRQSSSDNSCQDCTETGGSKYFGSTGCYPDYDVGSKPPVPSPTDGVDDDGDINDTGDNDFEEDSTVRSALEAIYTQCGGPDWTSSINWMSTETHYCYWEGVQCSFEDSAQVAGISLRSNNLVGKFPSQEVFENIPLLDTLVLDGNPKVDFTFDSIHYAKRLQILDLTHTELNSIKDVSAAPNITSLYLSSNNLRGPFPEEILQLTTLERLGLAFNQFIGPIPAGISELTNLVFLSLHDNVFTGSIPSEIGLLKNLYFVLMQSNDLSSTIPENLENLDDLRFLDLSSQTSRGGTGLTGRVPSFTNLPNLKRLDLSSNNLSGSVPINFLLNTPSNTFEHLNMNGNKLNGTLPSILKKFPVDQYDFTDNLISGIDESLCDPALGGAVQSYKCNAVLCPPGYFNSEGRQLTDDNECNKCSEGNVFLFYGSTTCGESDSTSVPTMAPEPDFDQELKNIAILSAMYDALNGDKWNEKTHWKDASTSPCSWYGIKCTPDGMQNILSITLSGNNLQGTVPTEIYELPKLESMILDLNNQLDMNFRNIGRANSLSTLDLSSTGVGNLKDIGDARALKELHLVANALTGTIESGIFDIVTLEHLALGFNEITGSISSEIGKLTNLKAFSAENNQISGQIPPSMGKLTDLNTLRLSKNSFTGTLPTQIEQMTSLNFIDLSHQHGDRISGPLPSFQSQVFLRRVDLHDNAFTGTVPPLFLAKVNPDVFEFADLSSNKISGTFPSTLARLDSVYLQNNEISGISPDLCSGSRGPIYQQYSCDAVLCPPGKYNIHGRQESDVMYCRDCPSSLFYGATKCDDDTPNGPEVSERDVLVKLYNTCGGDRWDDSTNWLKDSVSICNWYGIKCAHGGSVENIISIDLGANNIVGVPPVELYYLPKLQSLSLYSNPLTGFTFDGIDHAHNLKELLLDATGLTSLMGIGDAPNLRVLNLRFNALRGHFPNEISELTTLESLMMSYNDFTGSLPAFLEDMTNLKSLLLTSNSFSGPLDGFSFPSSMRYLDLSDNAFQGAIPDSFLTLIPFDAQIDVDLSNNLLTGELPTDLVRFDQLNLYVANNRITGMDDEFCSKTQWNDGDVGTYGCFGLLCPVGHFAPSGRQKTRDEPCIRCDNGGGQYLGMNTCDDSSGFRRGGNQSFLGLLFSSVILATILGPLQLFLH